MYAVEREDVMVRGYSIANVSEIETFWQKYFLENKQVKW